MLFDRSPTKLKRADDSLNSSQNFSVLVPLELDCAFLWQNIFDHLDVVLY
jgi:hypothetical protein